MGRQFQISANGCGQLWLGIKFLIPFLAVLPFATSYIGDRSSGYIGMYIGRVSYKNYLRSKLCACFIGGFILAFIPLIINLLLCNAAFAHNGNYYMGDIGSTILAGNLTGRTLQYNTAYPELPLADLFVRSAFLYNLLYTFMFSGFIGLLSVSVLALSFFFRKHKIVLFAPIFVLQRVFMALTNLSIQMAPKGSRGSAMNFDLIDYFVPDTERGQNPIYALILILALCAFSYAAYRYILKRPLAGIQGD